MNHTKPINKEFLEDDSNFYTAFTQYNLDEIWKSERELKYMIKVLFVCHGNICTLQYKQDKVIELM